MLTRCLRNVHEDPFLPTEFAHASAAIAEMVVTDAIAEFLGDFQPRFDLLDDSRRMLFRWRVHIVDPADKSKWDAQEAIVPCHVFFQAPVEAGR